VFTYLRVLYARIGHRPCPACGENVPPPYEPNGQVRDDEFVESGPDDGESSTCPHCGAMVPEMGMANFSFNKPAGACPTCTGLGMVDDANLDRLIDWERSVVDGAIYGWDIHYIKRGSVTLQAAGDYYGFPFDPNAPIKELGQVQRDLLL